MFELYSDVQNDDRLTTIETNIMKTALSLSRYVHVYE